MLQVPGTGVASNCWRDRPATTFRKSSASFANRSISSRCMVFSSTFLMNKKSSNENSRESETICSALLNHRSFLPRKLQMVLQMVYDNGEVFSQANFAAFIVNAPALECLVGQTAED